jgi:hypothetical protein
MQHEHAALLDGVMQMQNPAQKLSSDPARSISNSRASDDALDEVRGTT